MRYVIMTIMLAVLCVSSQALASEYEAGEAVYKSACAMCHKSGIAGAPKLEDKEAWTERLAQGEATLIEHSIKGFKGATGYMPPKGGKSSLTDAEVSSAVRYMISVSK